MIRIFLCRHNISLGMENYAARQEFTDEAMPLSPQGLKDREITGRVLKDYLNAEANGPVTLVSSHFKRTVQDAEGIKTALTPRKVNMLVPDRRLGEIDKGAYWGLTQNARKAKYGQAAADFYQKRKKEGKFFETKFLGGESPQDVYVNRVEPFVRDYKKDFHEGDLVIVSHDLTLRLLLMKLLHKDAKFVESEKPSGCGGIRLLEGESWKTLQDKGYIYEGMAPPPRPDHPEDLGARATSAGSWLESKGQRGHAGSWRGGRY